MDSPRIGGTGQALRWNHEISRGSLSRIGVRDMLSCQSLMLAAAGTPMYEKLELWLGTANWRGGFCHAPPRPQRGTSPLPREVFDRTTFPSPHPFWIPAFAGIDDTGRLFAGIPRHNRNGVGVYPGSESGTCFRANPLCWLLPAHQCMKSWSCGLVRRIGAVGSATPHLRPQRGTSPSPREVFDRTTFPSPHPFWIPAFAGMTIRKIDGIPRHNRNGVTNV